MRRVHRLLWGLHPELLLHLQLGQRSEVVAVALLFSTNLHCVTGAWNFNLPYKMLLNSFSNWCSKVGKITATAISDSMLASQSMADDVQHYVRTVCNLFLKTGITVKMHSEDFFIPKVLKDDFK